MPKLKFNSTTCHNNFTRTIAKGMKFVAVLNLQNTKKCAIHTTCNEAHKIANLEMCKGTNNIIGFNFVDTATREQREDIIKVAKFLIK